MGSDQTGYNNIRKRVMRQQANGRKTMYTHAALNARRGDQEITMVWGEGSAVRQTDD